jgi:hypothetical protein
MGQMTISEKATSMSWTAEQILALAPDDASGKAGRGLAAASKWVLLGHDARAVWGECKGSGASPYQVQIDLAEPAFRCTCPSRKFPCKHGIGLFLIYSTDGRSVPETAAPAWVTEWLAKREETAQKREERAAEPKTGAQLAKAAEVQVKRAANRQARVTQGLQDLDLWLCDLLRQGIATLPARSPKCWDEQAARLVDAQAPGVARMLHDMGGIPNSGDGWPDRLLERLGLLHLLLEGYTRLESGQLSEANRADIREAVGWNVRQEEVLAGAGVPDCWLVVGQRSYEEEQFRVQRTWLLGQTTGRSALLLDFLRSGQAPAHTYVPGAGFDAELAFYPGAWPLRALVREQRSAPTPVGHVPGHPDAAAMLAAYAAALAANPWIEPFPAALAAIIPVSDGDRWAVRDQAGMLLPLPRSFAQPWRLLAVSGGHPVTLFGEWDGAALLPLSVWADGRYVKM